MTHVFSEVNLDGSLAPGEFQMMADAGGVRFIGESTRIINMDELDMFAKQVTAAWKCFDRLRPKILNEAGH